VKRLAAAADLQPYLPDGHGSPADVSAHTIRHSVTGVGIESHIRHRIFYARRVESTHDFLRRVQVRVAGRVT
jgi:hypothetical protein